MAMATGARGETEIGSAKSEPAALSTVAAAGARRVNMEETPQEVKLAATEVGAEAEAVILIADTHVVIETVIITAAEVDAPALAPDLQMATIATAEAVTVATETVTTMAIADAMTNETASVVVTIEMPRAMPLLHS